MQSWSSPPNGNNPTTLLTYIFLFVRRKQIRHLNNDLFCIILQYHILCGVSRRERLSFHFVSFAQIQSIIYSRLTSKRFYSSSGYKFRASLTASRGFYLTCMIRNQSQQIVPLQSGKTGLCSTRPEEHNPVRFSTALQKRQGQQFEAV